MGHVPIAPLPPPLPTSAAMALAQNEPRWRRAAYGRPSRLPWRRDRRVGGRHSLLAWRRRAAHDAVLALIRAREAILGWRDDPWAPEPDKTSTRYDPPPVFPSGFKKVELVDGMGRTVAIYTPPSGPSNRSTACEGVVQDGRRPPASV